MPTVGRDGGMHRVSVALAPDAPVARLTSVVVAVCRSRTRMPAVSPAGARRGSSDANAIDEREGLNASNVT